MNKWTFFSITVICATFVYVADTVLRVYEEV